MNHIICANVNGVKYWLKFDKSWAVPHRKVSYEGLKDNATILSKQEAETTAAVVKSHWPLTVESI